jgi:hypothetical protein
MKEKKDPPKKSDDGEPKVMASALVYRELERDETNTRQLAKKSK